MKQQLIFELCNESSLVELEFGGVTDGDSFVTPFRPLSPTPQMVSKLPMMKSICNLHIDKLEFFRLLHPDTAFSFPPLYREVFCSEVNFPDSTAG